jgi:hypothetical protein
MKRSRHCVVGLCYNTDYDYDYNDYDISTYYDAGNDSVKFFADVMTEQADGKLQILQIQGGKKLIKTNSKLNTKPGKNSGIQTNLNVKVKCEQK